MACYVEEEVWKCPKHPAKRRRNGICPVCLRERLDGLCPHCANVRPCACVASTSSSSSSTSSSFSRVIDGEPPLHRSRSFALKTPSFLSTLRRSKTKRCEAAAAAAAAERGEGFVGENNFDSHNRIEDFAKLITRSRSVSVGTTEMTSGFRRSKDNSSPSKGKFWHFPSPMTVFRSSKSTKVIGQDRSPLHRG